MSRSSVLPLKRANARRQCPPGPMCAGDHFSPQNARASGLRYKAFPTEKASARPSGHLFFPAMPGSPASDGWEHHTVQSGFAWKLCPISMLTLPSHYGKGVILLRKKGLRKIRQDMARPPVFATFLFQDTGFPEIMQDSKQFLLIHTEDFPQTNRASFSTQGMQKDRRPCCIILHATFMGKSIFSVHGSSSVFPFFAIFWKTRPQYGLFQKKTLSSSGDILKA